LYFSATGEFQRFEESAPVVPLLATTRFTSRDIIVIAEPYAAAFEVFREHPVRKVMHCQNPFYLFAGWKDSQAIEAYGLDAVLSCSPFTTRWLRRVGVRGPIHTISPAVAACFRMAGTPKKRQIAFMPRKRKVEADFVKGLFRSLYPQYQDLPWVAIDRVSRDQVAALLQESAVFASFSQLEGLGLPPLEAMACGCVVVGFTGMAGSDYARWDNGVWVDEADHEGFAHALGSAIAVLDDVPRWQSVVRAAAMTAGEFNEDRFMRGLDHAWREVLKEDRSQYLLAQAQ
jgi:hypothetical protein